MGRTSTQARTAQSGSGVHLREVAHVAGYLRVSTEEQRESGLGIAAQRTRVLGMAAAKGWPVPTIYADEGISGTKEPKDRPALAHLLADVAAGAVDAVIVLSCDRLARRTLLILGLVETFRRAGVALVSCKEQLDTTTPTGQFFLTITAGFAQLERDLAAERTRAALDELGKTTGDKGGRVPYGYVRIGEDGAVRIDRQAAEMVRRIFEWHRRGLSLRAIAERVRASGLPSPRARQWHHSSIAEILGNRAAYLGGQRGASDRRWPAILGKHQEAA